MQNAFRYVVTLMAFEHVRFFVIDIQQQLALEHEEKFVLLVVFVPVELAVKYAQPDERIVYGRERLIEPWNGTRGSFRIGVDQRGIAELVLEMDLVLAGAHALSAA